MMQEYRTKELYGDFYENEGKPLVVIIGGSRPGLPAPLNKDYLERLKKDFQVLLLAYFGAGDLPESLECLPMEYFVNAVSAIKQEYGIGDREVIVIGQSKGGEAALLLTNYMRSAVTIALVPSCYAFQGLPTEFILESFTNRKSSWSFQGKELPYIKFYFDQEIVKEIMAGNYCTCYEASIEKNGNEDALIRVDGYTGKILLISEENDRYWPSRAMSEQLVKRSGNRENMRHISMKLDGHYLMNYEESAGEIVKYLEEYLAGKR